MGGSFLFVLLVLFAFMYLLLIRPQRQQQRRQAEMINALKPGDEVITVGGVYGEIKSLDDERVRLEVDADVELVVARRAITSLVPPDEAVDEDESEGAAPLEGDRAAR